ncbi:MAG: hypothetical protein ACREN8_02155 [Candidatus Dormibacteraceae bacterium]
MQQPRGRSSRAVIHRRLALEIEELRSHLGGLPSPAQADLTETLEAAFFHPD